MQKNLITLFLSTSLFFVAFNAKALESLESKQEGLKKGLEIATKAQKANSDYISEKSQSSMILLDALDNKSYSEAQKKGQESSWKGGTVRLMDNLVKEIDSDGDKSLMTFLTPFDVKGTKMLTWGHKQGDDDQWLFLPSLKRAKRISGSGQSASFMGSEFSFEDLGSQEIEKYQYQLIKEEKFQGDQVWILERRPKNSNSSYSKQVIWMSQKYLNPLRIDYYDKRSEQLIKSATFSDYKEYKVGKKSFWRTHMISMENVLNKKRSLFKWQERHFGDAVNDELFKKESLR